MDSLCQEKLLNQSYSVNLTDEDQTIVEEAEESNAFINKSFEPYENSKHTRNGSRVYMKSIEQVIPYNKIALHNNKVEKYLEI